MRVIVRMREGEGVAIQRLCTELMTLRDEEEKQGMFYDIEG